MKSLRFSEFGPPSVLQIEQLPIPTHGPGEALVRVKAAAMNPSDIGDVAGRFKKTTLPRTPGRDFAGKDSASDLEPTNHIQRIRYDFSDDLMRSKRNEEVSRS